MISFFDWAYNNGDKMALELDYVPMPASIVKQVRQDWTRVMDKAGKPVWQAK